MKLTRHSFTWIALAVLGVLTILAIAGHPVISPEALAGLGMVPFAGHVSLEDVKEILVEQGQKGKEFKARYDEEMKAMRDAVDEIQKKANRPGWSGINVATGHAFTPEERKAFDGAVRALMTGNKEKADQLFVEAKAMSAGSGPDGGYMVHTQFSTGFTKVMAEISPIYRQARVIPLDPGNDSFEEPIDSETAEAHWTGEQSARNESGTPGIKMFYVSLGEIYALPRVTQKLVDLASFDVMAWLQTKVGEAFGTKESAAFHNGDSIEKPRGFLTYDIATTADASRPWGTIQYIPSGASGAFKSASASVSPADALIDMVTALKPQYRSGARWYMNRNTAGVVRKFKDADGRFVWVDSIISGQPSTLLGYPVEIDEDMPDIAADSLSVAFGNMQRAYTIIEKPGIKFVPDPYMAKPHVLLYSYRRVGGGLNNSEALKLMKFSAT